MSAADDSAVFEQRLRAILEESAQRAPGRVRSRLNRARHAAVIEALAGGPQRPGWRRQLWMPAAGALAAAAAAFVLWPRAPRPAPPAAVVRAAASGDLDLLTDRDGLTLIENGDGEFYEWAVYEARARQGTGSGAGHAD